jgi:hypothetical protein
MTQDSRMPWEDDPLEPFDSGRAEISDFDTGERISAEVPAGPAEEPLGPLAGAGMGLIRGAIGTVGGLISAAKVHSQLQVGPLLERAVGIDHRDPYEQILDRFHTYARRASNHPAFKKSPEARGYHPERWRFWTETFTEVIPQLAVQVAATRGTTGVAQLGAFAMAGGSMEAGYHFAETETRLRNKGMKPEEAEKLAVTEASIVGAINSAVEVLPAAAILRRNPAAKKIFDKALQQRLLAPIVKNRILTGVLAEGVEEAVQEAVADTVHWAAENDPEAFRGLGERMAIGATMGGLAGGSLVGLQVATDPAERKPVTAGVAVEFAQQQPDQARQFVSTGAPRCRNGYTTA